MLKSLLVALLAIIIVSPTITENKLPETKPIKKYSVIPTLDAPVHAQAQELSKVPTPPPVPPTPPVQAPVGCEAYRSVVSQYNWNVSIAMAIIQAESSCNPNAVGDTYPINGLLAPSCGLAQIRTLRGRPSCDQLKNPATNIEWMYKISGSGTNWKPWSVYTNGKFRNFLR